MSVTVKVNKNSHDLDDDHHQQQVLGCTWTPILQEWRLQAAFHLQMLLELAKAGPQRLCLRHRLGMNSSDSEAERIVFHLASVTVANSWHLLAGWDLHMVCDLQKAIRAYACPS